MKTTIKLTLLAAIGTALLAVPATAQTTQKRQAQRVLQYRAGPAPGVFRNDTVIEDGQYLGRDPDPNVRSQLLKTDSDYNGNSY